jgi:hypothetical protein
VNRIVAMLPCLVVFAAIPLTAAEPVALRVEVSPLGPGPGGVRVAVVVHVSPEDRGRIGANAMLRVELDGEAPPGQSPQWAVRMADDGSGRIETVWPPGEHRLEVEISNPSRRDSGLWVGTVRIPDPGAASAEQPRAPEEAPVRAAAETAPEAGSPVARDHGGPPDAGTGPGVAASAEVAGASAAAGGAAGSAPDSPPAAPLPESPLAVGEVPPADPDRDPTEAVAAAAAGPAPVEQPEGPMAGQTPVEEPAEAAAGPAAVEEPVEPIAEPVPVEEPAEAVAEQAADEEPVEPMAEAAPDEHSAEPVGVAAPVEEAPEPIVEPLRGDPAPSAVPSPPPAPAVQQQQPPPAVAAAHAAWAGAGSDTVELTAVVLRGREPARDLRPDDLLLRVGGVEVPVAALGGAQEAPLLLGIAVDAAADKGVGWPGGGDLASLTRRAAEGLGSSFYAASGGLVGEWGAEPPAAAPGGTGGDVASLVVDVLRRFDGTRGRRFLLVVTDGRNEPPKDAWREAVAAAGEAGTPVLVVALWDEGFSRRTRNNLREIAEVSGGSLFLVQGGAQLDRAAERFGPLLDAGVAVRFRVPAGVALPAEVRLEGVQRGLEVATAERLR